jgi:hypothetical protein
MNCFTGTSSDQWKAVCCRRECVEQNWILFSSEVLTALCIRYFLGTVAQWQKVSITFFMSVCLSDRKYQRGSHWTNLREICLRVYVKMY